MDNGFPKPLFKDQAELREQAKAAGSTPVEYLIHHADVGRLRSSDAILGDLTVTAREAVGQVKQRLMDMAFDEIVEATNTQVNTHEESEEE